MRNKTASSANLSASGAAVSAIALDALDIIPRHYADLRHARKRLMAITGASEGAVKGWLAGTHFPHFRHLVSILAHNAEIKAEIDRLVEAEMARR